MGDVWISNLRSPDDEARQIINDILNYASESGRNPDEIGIEAWVSLRNMSPEQAVVEARAWAKIGATHISINTMNAGLKSPKDHIEAIRRFKTASENI